MNMNELGRWWADKFGLKDWKFEFKFLTRTEMLKHNMTLHTAAGFCKAWIEMKSAEILICTDEDTEYPSTVEETLVHELLHVWVWQFFDSDDITPDQSIRLEQSLNALSSSLVELRQS